MTQGRPDTSGIIPGRVLWPPMAAMQRPPTARRGGGGGAGVIDRFLELGELLVAADAAPRQANRHFRRGDREALPQTRRAGLGIGWNKLQVGKPVRKKRSRLKFCRLAPIGPLRKKIVIETKQTAGLRETAHARGKQTGRKKKPRRKT